ncbi:MAG: CHAT domain-containing protein [Bacteroidales bacterium]|nr:CHAT domain-containing protein [Bacteroidales bacterium]
MKKIFLLILLVLPVIALPQSKEADKVYNKGVKLYEAKKYEQAITFFKQSDSLEKAQLHETDSNYHRSKLKIADCLGGIVDNKVENQNLSEAIKLQTEIVQIFKSIFGENHYIYANTLNYLAYYHYLMNNYTEAIRTGTRALEIYKTTLGEEHQNYVGLLNNLAHYNSDLGNNTEAIRLETIALEIRKKVLGENHPDYALLLNNLAYYYAHTDNYVEAIKLKTKAMEILGKEHPDYVTLLNDLAFYNYNIDNYAESIRLGTMAMETYKEVLGSEQYEYANSLDNLSVYYSAIGNYIEAIKYGAKALQLYKKILGVEHPVYATALDNLADYYSKIGHYSEAIRFATLAMNIKKKNYGEGNPDYAISLSHLAYYNYIIGNYTEAIRYETMATEISKKVFGEKTIEYANTLNNLASYYSTIGNFTEAISLVTKAMTIKKGLFGEEHPEYATSLSNLAVYYSETGNYTEAIRLEKIAMNIRKNVLGEDHSEYATSLNNLAYFYSELSDYSEAIRLSTIAMEIKKKALGEEHIEYATTLGNLACFYFENGKFEEATELGTLAKEIKEKILGKNHPDYAILLSNLIFSYLAINKYDDAINYTKQTYKCFSSIILEYFSSMTTKERSDVWKQYSIFFTNGLPYIAVQHHDATSTTLAYNGQVLSKGLLLNAELEIQKILEQSNDTTFVNLYYKIRQDRVILDNLYQIAPENREMDADSLAKVIDREEHILVQSSKELGDYTKNLSINWTDVQKKLKGNDVAIEFASFTDDKNLSVYIALVLKKGMTAPELVLLDYSDNDTIDYTTTTLYNKIWKPLDNYLQGVQNVYFSPSGKFHTIGIEYLSDDSGEIFAKKYNAYRLSSTRELAIDRVVNLNKKASVYGGIVYNFTQDDWQNVSEDAERAGITFLKGAKVESEEITNILSENSFNVEYGTDKAATEESFKKLSGSGIKILHIATHGFYEPESKEKSFANLLSSDDEHSQEDLSLSRSGLFFAGANTALDPEQRKYIPEGVDDGILTAKEISRMDFKGLDLVVMSACQTGLGEVTSEGVFGLQRGFKKAGAQTIVMSLWKVNDKPTKELMTEFYRNLVAGKSKREAFISAQDKIRVKYIDPKMWAGFIMVDGIE